MIRVYVEWKDGKVDSYDGDYYRVAESYVSVFSRRDGAIALPAYVIPMYDVRGYTITETEEAEAGEGA